MPIGLRAAHAPRIQELCKGDKRLLMRVGALLQQRLSLTEAVLEEIEYSPELRKLLMDRKLGTVTSEEFAPLSEHHECQDVGLLLSDIEDDWRCLHLEDEVNNIFADAEAEEDTNSDSEQSEWTHSVSELLPTLHASVRTPLEGLLSAQGDEQRAAAIEQLRYAAPSLNVVSELLPMILVDGADVVRERGIGLLTAAGANPVVTDLIRAMHRNDHKTLDRLTEHLSRLPADQQELVFAALIANATRGSLSHGTIKISCEIASVIAQHRGLPRYIELLLLHGTDIGLVRFIRLLQDENHNAVDDVLRAFLGQSSTIDAKVLILLAHPKANFDDHLMHMGVDFLISEKEEPK